MAENSAIEWTDTTWNPTSGCTKVSPGCAHCYIERTPPMRMAGRKFKNGKIPLEFHHDRLDAPLHWRKPRRVFVNSMSDLFHEDVPRAFIREVLDVAVHAGYQHGHTFQILTKRAERMRDEVTSWLTEGGLCGAGGFCPENHPQGHTMPECLWLGVSVEDQQRADERIPLLLQTPAAVRFLSCEPLLGPVDLTQIRHPMSDPFPDHAATFNCMTLEANGKAGSRIVKGNVETGRISWIIVGGESGHGARPCDINWIRSIVEQCRAAGVACFVKQLGSKPIDTGHQCRKHYPGHCGLCNGFRDSKGGNPREWPQDLRVREFPATSPAGSC